MPKKIIEVFMPRFKGLNVEIQTEIGAVINQEGFHLIAKRIDSKIEAKIVYQNLEILYFYLGKTSLYE